MGGMEKIEPTFREFVTAWRNETWYISSIKKKVAHPAHLKIIGLGRPALPLIFRELRTFHDYWFSALESITREDPAPNAENIQDLTEAWLGWANENGY